MRVRVVAWKKPGELEAIYEVDIKFRKNGLLGDELSGWIGRILKRVTTRELWDISLEIVETDPLFGTMRDTLNEKGGHKK